MVFVAEVFELLTGTCGKKAYDLGLVWLGLLVDAEGDGTLGRLWAGLDWEMQECDSELVCDGLCFGIFARAG